ncbi:MAG: sodium/solute symporter [Pseudomonadota bacterium]
MAWLDVMAIAGYGLAVLLFGLVAGGRTETSSDYFLAGRKEAWGPVAASTWATKLSALTFIGVPGAAISGNFAYLQLWFGSFLAAYLVAVIFLPEFYRLQVSTVYEYLGRRVGPLTRLSGTVVFIISRCLASAVRLAGCAIAVSVFFDVGLVQAIVLIAGLAAVYVLSGGLRAVIWTDVLQLVLFLAGAVATIVFVGTTLSGGFQQIADAGAAANMFQVFDFSFSLSDPTTFWLGNLFAVVLGLATGGADQDIAQRALACPNVKQARIAVIAAGAADLVSTFLFLTAGAAVFAYYESFPQDAVAALMAEGRHDYVFPHFIRHELPEGLRGLLIAALLAAAMSSLDSALSGLASSAHYDLRLSQPTSAGQSAITPRGLVVIFAIILACIAIWFGNQPGILWFGLQIMGYTYGGLLGLFLIALFFSRYVNDLSCVIAVFTSICVVLIATQWGLGFGPVPWPWAVIIGVSWTCGLALVLARVFSRSDAKPEGI